MKKKIDGYEFIHVSNITPFLDEDGYPIEFFLTSDEEIKNTSDKTYVNVPFCNFRISPSKWSGKKGVFAIYINEKLAFLDSCESLKYRINNQYGTINKTLWIKQYYSKFAHVNMSVLSEYKKGKRLSIYYYESFDHDSILSELLENTSPIWNQKPTKKITQKPLGEKKSEFEEINKLKRVSANTLKKENYQSLQCYLEELEVEEISLSFKEIETILGSDLPASAYNFRTWWQYGGKYHKAYWRNAGFKVKKVKLGEFCVFEKIK